MNERIPPIEPALLLEHADFVRALARRLIRDPAGADDLEQETWLRALQRRPTEHSNLRAWLAAVLHNVARNRARSLSRRNVHERAGARTDAAPPSSLAAEQSDTLRSVVGAVLELEEPYRSTLLALYFQGLPAGEIARLENVPEATVRSRHRRALAKMRERLDARHGARAAWCVPLAELTGLTTGKAALGAPLGAFATAAALLVALAGVGAWLALRSPAPASDSARVAGAGELSNSALAASAQPDAQAERRPAAQSERVLRGVLLDALSESAGGPTAPAAGVEVFVDSWSGAENALEKHEQTLTTDASGRFEVSFGALSDALRRVQVAAAETASHRSALREWEVAPTWTGEFELQLVRPRHGLLTLEVQTPDGEPVIGVATRLVQPDNSTRFDAVTDERGVARFAEAAMHGVFFLLSEQWTPLGYEAPQPRESGGWRPARIVACATGRVRVRVTNARGDGLPGVEVELARANWERDIAVDSQWGAPYALGSRNAVTDEAGEAQFERVWSGVDLRVVASRRGSSLEAVQRRGDGRLIGLDEAGLALRVPAQGELALEARFGAARRMQLSFAHTSGRALRTLNVQVVDVRSGRRASADLFRSWEVDPARTLTLELDAPELVGPLVVHATENEPDDPRRFLSAGDGEAQRERAQIAVASARFELASGSPLEAALELRDTLPLSGSLLGHDGAPALHRDGAARGWRVQVVPAGLAALEASRAEHPSAHVEYLGDSAFRVEHLAPGRYDVLVSEQLAGHPSFGIRAQRFEGLEPGPAQHELRLRESGSVRVRLRVDPARFGGRCTSLIATLAPSEPRSLAQSPAPQRQRVDGLAAWPLHAPRDFTGASGADDALGRWSYALESARTGTLELPELGAGWYLFGVDAQGDGGTRFAPAASALAYYAPGEYELEFELAASADLRGVVRRTSERLLAVELLAEDGRRVGLRNERGALSSATALRAFVPRSGLLELRDVPHGRFRLRAGAPAQLDLGQFEREIEVLVNAFSTPFELDLR